MAAPREITIECLNGHWVLNKDLTSEPDPILKLQKVSWLLRKAFGLATIHLHISQYQTPASESTEPSTHIDFNQTAAGLAPTEEKRILDWEIRDHQDYFFGEVKAQCEFVHGAVDADGIVRPEFEFQTPNVNAQIKKFMRGEIEVDGSKSAGFIVEDWSGMADEGPGLWVHTCERNDKSGWTAEQIWGFEMLGDSRYFSRRVVVMTTKGEYLCGRIVFDFVSA
ncbi:hypothetical protein E8E15_010622 [Penicillium rubens]|uniref:Pc12g08640 protein n=2 Tax=Penicillium chrysogenum species complex TaxID=254878 RepID=B6GYB1_PENRW|nr:uncharacterized protein N7525_001699 [Penicillium rubens]KZN85078.1 hypothetical protein EN45_092500 [Penicillium chrysogenum]CAP80491.1 Pc12g08640 [Penicillium rubens Wisconsin 54-1255]KAF3029048.1 hypothetical protein E8E15_010622 [Penicillium rubens]KAJ5034337.1 hypothetical protein NUH16_005774 [Penicillium rubens]KAJ5843958.1 hypothetical protein N7525_001699 [Penicillium rubens]